MPDADWHATYLPERDNVRAALDWAFGAGTDPAIGVALAGASAVMWIELSLYLEGRRRLDAALARVAAHTPESHQARLWLWLGSLQGPAAPTLAEAALERAVDLYRRLSDAVGLGLSLARLGSRLAFMGRFDQATSVLAEALPVVERAGPPKLLAGYFEASGFLKMLTGDPASARMHFEKALSLYRSVGAECHALGILGQLADSTWALGDLDDALVGFRETVALLRKSLTMRSMLGPELLNLAGAHTERGELDEALAAAREGLPLVKEMGFAWHSMDHLALRAARAGKVANAVRLVGFADSTYMAKQSARQPNEARAHDRLQALLREQLAPDELERLLVEGAKLTEDEACQIALEE